MRLLICSDGLTKEVGDERIRLHLAAGMPAAETASALVDAALAGGRTGQRDRRRGRRASKRRRETGATWSSRAPVRGTTARVASEPVCLQWPDSARGEGVVVARRLPSQPPVLPGFSYVHVLGSGGFADVFLYEQNMPRRQVAVKVMLSEVVNDQVRQMFQAEANLMAQLSAHPSILTVYQASVSADGRPYLVMELCSSRSASGTGASASRCPRCCASRSRSAARSRPRTAPACCTATSSRPTSC